MTLFTQDRRLLVAFRAGDREALGLTYNHYVRPLASFIQAGFSFRSKDHQHFFRGIRSAYEVDNALQEVFARAFAPDARARYDGVRTYFNYLCAIAKNYLIDEARRSSKRGGGPVDLADIDADTAMRLSEEAFKAPGAATERRELQALLETFMHGRSAREQGLYDIRYGDHRTQTETAERMGLTRVQVRRIEASLLGDLLTYLRANGYLTDHEVSVPILVRGAGCWLVVSGPLAYEIIGRYAA